MKIKLTALTLTLGAIILSNLAQGETYYNTTEQSWHSNTHHRKKIRRSMRKSPKSASRSYDTLLTPEQDKTLGKLLLFIGNQKLSAIFKKRHSLKEKGDTLRQVHPFRFLAKSYSEDQLVAAMCSIVGKPFVWGDFKEGLYNALTEEFKRNNLKQFVPDFANNVRVDYALIMPQIENQDWDGLMKVLNDNAPRTGNPNRYDY